MKKSFLFFFLLSLLPLMGSKEKDPEFPSNYDQIKEALKKGWNTWSTYSMGQHLLLPYGFSLNLGLYKGEKVQAVM